MAQLVKKSAYNVAIAGATGAVGDTFLQILEERNFPIAELRLLASKRSAGKTLKFKGKDYTVQELTHDSFKDIDIALFLQAAEEALSLPPLP
jgi:aspartate-semialdehyde dehydrogenase